MYTALLGATPSAAAAPSMTSVRRTARDRLRSSFSKKSRNGSTAGSPTARNAHAPSTETTFLPSAPRSSGSRSRLSAASSGSPLRSSRARTDESRTTPSAAIVGKMSARTALAVDSVTPGGGGGGASDAATSASASSHGANARHRSFSRRTNSGYLEMNSWSVASAKTQPPDKKTSSDEPGDAFATFAPPRPEGAATASSARTSRRRRSSPSSPGGGAGGGPRPKASARISLAREKCRSAWSRTRSRRASPPQRSAEHATQQPCTRCATLASAASTSSGSEPAGAKCMTLEKRRTVRWPRAKSACTRCASGRLSSCALERPRDSEAPNAAFPEPSPRAPSPPSPSTPSSLSDAMGHTASRYAAAVTGMPAGGASGTGTPPARPFPFSLFDFAPAFGSAKAASPSGPRATVTTRSRAATAYGCVSGTGVRLDHRSSSSSCFKYACECRRISVWRSVSRRFTCT